MKGSTNNPSMAIDGLCDICGTMTDNCDGDRCDSCGNWTCYECGTHVVSGVNTNEWLCPGCAEVAELAAEMEGEE